jgi:phosphinothricin acetyltransferase
MVVSIMRMHPGDWPAVEEIYRQGMGTGKTTFETDSPGWDK